MLQKALLCAFCVCFVASLSAIPSFASQVFPLPTSIVNGSFEENTAGAGGQQSTPGTASSNQWDQLLVPGWSTTEVDTTGNLIELWYGGPTNVGFQPTNYPGGVAFPASDGVWCAEINAQSSGTLYQGLSTSPGSLYQWSLYHRGRQSATVADVMRVYIGEYTNNPAEIDALPAYPEMLVTGLGTTDLADTRTGWGAHLGYYVATSDETTIGLHAFYTASIIANPRTGNSMGNLVDDVSWVKIADPYTQTIYVGDAYPTDADMVDNLYAGFDPAADYSGANNLAPDTYTVPVDIVDAYGNIVGTVRSTLIVLDKPDPPDPYQNGNGDPADPSPLIPATGDPAGSCLPGLCVLAGAGLLAGVAIKMRAKGF
ncbi:MAG: hypothetical protein FWD72_03265 [Eggerthellaceae bacterium]|nr:hypothetical protein [Eggerthellaceae bacterium]